MAPRPVQISYQHFREGCCNYLEQRGPYADDWEWRDHPFVPTLGHLRRTFKLPVRFFPPPAEGQSTTAQEDPGNLDVDDWSNEIGAQVDEFEDVAVASPSSSKVSADPDCSIFEIDQLILYSSTWKVPILYLSARPSESRHDESAVSLSELLTSSLFHAGPSQADATPLQHLLHPSTREVAMSSGSSGPIEPSQLTYGPAYFPPVSTSECPLGDSFDQREGSALSRRQWLYLHPCQTATLVGEMMAAREQHGQGPGLHEKAVASPMHYIEAFMAICASAVEMRA